MAYRSIDAASRDAVVTVRRAATTEESHIATTCRWRAVDPAFVAILRSAETAKAADRSADAATPEVSPGVLPGELEPAVAAGVPTARRAGPVKPPPASVVYIRCGGSIGDRVGFKAVIWGSILGVAPFTLLLPYADLPWTVLQSVPIGLVLSSAFSAIVVYAQELVPGRVGMMAGLFVGFLFGMGAIGAALLGRMADEVGIAAVYRVCGFLPLIGLLTAFLPNLRGTK